MMVASPIETLRAAFGALSDPLVEEREDGPAGLVAYRARPVSAPPGAGGKALIVAPDGVFYASFLERGLADLSRALGWLDAPPSAEAVAFVVDHLLFAGLLAPVPNSSPSIQQTNEALLVRLTTEAFPTGARDVIEVRIPRDGPATFVRSAEPGVAEPTPIDEVTALVRALDADDALAIMRAARAVADTSTPRARHAVARAALSPNQNIAGEALLKLLADPVAVSALRAALADLPSERRDAARAFAEAFFGQGALS